MCQTVSPAHDAAMAAAIACDDARIQRAIMAAAAAHDAAVPVPSPAGSADDWLRRMAEQDAAMRRAIESKNAGSFR